MHLRIEHFGRDLSPEDARDLFKRSVNTVTVAISSYCNRQCSYCPNSITDRKSNRYYMSDDLFFSLMRQLTKIDYDDTIYIHRYNEPLAEKDYALARIRDIRVFLPKAKIRIFTNGDYLDRAYLDDLADLGVTEIVATVHAGPGGKTDIAALAVEQDRRVSELGLAFTYNDSEDDRVRVAVARHPKGLLLRYDAHDFYRGMEHGDAWAHDRGGVLPIPRKFVRTAPCLMQFVSVEVEWDGTLLPCCQIQNDAFAHDDYVLGKLTPESDIFTAWTNARYVKWRVRMSSNDLKDAPCTTCSYGAPFAGDTQTRTNLKLIRKQLIRATAQNAGG
jgi:radical SAM protein with 4Fe4S-binding SPASM domain